MKLFIYFFQSARNGNLVGQFNLPLVKIPKDKSTRQSMSAERQYKAFKGKLHSVERFWRRVWTQQS